MSGLVYGSVCSGIEAASVAWHPLGWRPSFVSDIEAFPRAVLQHRWPEAPLHGDFTTIEAGQYRPIDLLVGGTPCQSFSIAGLRGGLGDGRGNLALEFLRLADRLRPRWLVWENVPGVLSSGGGRDFGSILGGMAQLGYGFAYRVLDAQFFGVAQRRRRVFVVGHLGDWRRAAAVLLEPHGLRRDHPPRRQAREIPAATIAGGARKRGGYSADDIPLAGTLTAHHGNTKADHAWSGQIVPGDVSPTLGAGGHSRNPLDEALVARPLLAPRPGAGGQYRGDPETETLVAHSLRAEGFDASEDGTGRGTPLVPVCFSAKDYGADALDDLSPTLRAGGHSTSHANAGVMPAVAYGLRSDASRSGEAKTPSRDAAGRERLRDAAFNPLAECAPTLDTGAPHAVAYSLTPSNSNKDFTARPVERSQALTGGGGRVSARGGDLVLNTAVRRLTPRECERLQGFPDDYTLIPWRGGLAPDGPRYRALGNSMAVPVMAWIGQRIAFIDNLEAVENAA